MKILTAIFSCSKNLPYFFKSLEYWDKAMQKALEIFPTMESELLVIDFSEDNCKELQAVKGRYNFKPQAGFGKNFNAAWTYAFFGAFDFLINFNDDAIISEQFISEGLKLFERGKDIGMVGGIPNTGSWCSSLDLLSIPAPTNELALVDPMVQLKWECSAAIYRVEAILQTGKWDERFDIGGSGVCGDNDYYIRMIKAGRTLFRSGQMRFWHAKGITQSRVRIPLRGRPDPIKEANYAYLASKWGINREGMKIEDLYQAPFNAGA
jgi:hypothetical protein